jgi:hypothetical protein
MARIAASDNSRRSVAQDCKVVMKVIRGSTDSYRIDPGHVTDN